MCSGSIVGHGGRRRDVIDRLVPMTLRKVAVVLHLSSSHEQDTGDLESQALHRQGLGHKMKGCCGAQSGRMQVVVLRHFFSLALS